MRPYPDTNSGQTGQRQTDRQTEIERELYMINTRTIVVEKLELIGWKITNVGNFFFFFKFVII